MSQLSSHCTVVPFNLLIAWEMIRRSANRFDAKHFHHSDEEVRHEMKPLVRSSAVLPSRLFGYF